MTNIVSMFYFQSTCALAPVHEGQADQLVISFSFFELLSSCIGAPERAFPRWQKLKKASYLTWCYSTGYSSALCKAPYANDYAENYVRRSFYMTFHVVLVPFSKIRTDLMLKSVVIFIWSLGRSGVLWYVQFIVTCRQDTCSGVPFNAGGAIIKHSGFSDITVRLNIWTKYYLPTNLQIITLTLIRHQRSTKFFFSLPP